VTDSHSGTYTDTVNPILEGLLRAQVDEDVFVQPTIIVNGGQFRGNLKCPNTNELSRCTVRARARVWMCVGVWVCIRACACVRACVRACVCECV
jgi:hypothetical protein